MFLMRPAAILGLLLSPAVMGCNREPGPPVPLRSVVLHDVQGLWGGHALWAREDGAAVIQVVGPPPPGQSGLWEKRYNVKLTAAQWAEAERLVGAHHFLTLKTKERPGVPDEAHPTIAVVTKSGTPAKATKLANDKHSDFDPRGSHPASRMPVSSSNVAAETNPSLQSGATTSLSRGTTASALRIRSATTSAVSASLEPRSSTPRTIVLSGTSRRTLRSRRGCAASRERCVALQALSSRRNG